MNPVDQVRWDRARPQEVLLKTERNRAGDFLDLFDEQLKAVARDLNDPTFTEIAVARARAAMVWEYDRATNSGPALRQQLASPSWRERRRATLKEFTARDRLRNLALQAIAQSNDLLAVIREDLAGQVIELHEVKRRKTG